MGPQLAVKLEATLRFAHNTGGERHSSYTRASLYPRGMFKILLRLTRATGGHRRSSAARACIRPRVKTADIPSLRFISVL